MLAMSLFPRDPSNMASLSSHLQSADLCTMVYGVSELLDSSLDETKRLLSVVASSLPPSSHFLVIDPISHQFCCEKEVSVMRCFPSFKTIYRGHDKVSVSRQNLEPSLAPLCAKLGLEMSRDVKLSCHTWSLLLRRGSEESEAKRVCDARRGVGQKSGSGELVGKDRLDGDSVMGDSLGTVVNDTMNNTVNDTMNNTVNDTMNSTVNDTMNNTVNDTMNNTVNDTMNSTVNDMINNTTTSLILTQLPCLTQWITLLHTKTTTNVWVDKSAAKTPNRALFKRLLTAWRFHGGVLMLTYAQWE